MVRVGSGSGQGGTAVLCSAGLDSAVLLAHEAARGPVTPVYVSVGLAWEAEERAALSRLLAAAPLAGHVAAPAVLTFDMRDIYPPTHWAVRGVPPAYDTPDEDVYLVGRNLVLLTKAGVLCAQRRLSRIVIGPLAGNPFPDATAEFFASMARTLSLGLDTGLEVDAPFRRWHKADVVRRGLALGVPLALTLSCMSPRDGRHCGACSKCRERHDAFLDAGVDDDTAYVAPVPDRPAPLS
jgi:7-cyano-7-deazaguanine synthase